MTDYQTYVVAGISIYATVITILVIVLLILQRAQQNLINTMGTIINMNEATIKRLMNDVYAKQIEKSVRNN